MNAPDPTASKVTRVPFTTDPLLNTCVTSPTPGPTRSLRSIVVVLYSRLVAITSVCDPTVHSPTSTLPEDICLTVAFDAKMKGVRDGSDSANVDAEDLMSAVVGSVQGMIPIARD